MGQQHIIHCFFHRQTAREIDLTAGRGGSAIVALSAPSRIISRASFAIPARCSRSRSLTPVHSAFPIAPSSHCTPLTFGTRKTRLLPAHSSVTVIVCVGI